METPKTRRGGSRGKRPPAADSTSSTEAWEIDALPLDLRPELAVVRQVMRRLVLLWDRQGDDVPPEEARKLAALIFNGARTAAILLFQQTRTTEKKDTFAEWLDGALEKLGDEWGIDLMGNDTQ